MSSQGTRTPVEAVPDLVTALRRLRQAAARFAYNQIDTWGEQLKGVAAPSSTIDRAVVAGATAWATNSGNPAIAAVNAAWAGADAKTKAGMVTFLLLAAVLAPVVLLLILLGLLVAAIILRARRSLTTG